MADKNYRDPIFVILVIMILFIYGEDSYRSRRKLNEIIEHYKKIHKSGLSLNFFNFNDLKEKKEGGQFFPDFKNKLNQVSMFNEKKLQVLNNLFSDKNFKEKFLEEAENFSKSKNIFLIYQDEKVDERDALFKFLKKNAKCQEFKPLVGVSLKKWINKELDRRSAKIEPKALDKFLSFISNDLWQVNNELKKLVSFKKGKTIGSEDIDLMIKPKIETDIFRTIEAISQKEKKRALSLLRKHIESGAPPLYLLSMINFQFRNLLIIKELAEKNNPYYLILQKSGLHPFSVKKSYPIAAKFTLAELKKIYRKIFEIDYNIKTGKIEPEMALDLFVAEI